MSFPINLLAYVKLLLCQYVMPVIFPFASPFHLCFMFSVICFPITYSSSLFIFVSFRFLPFPFPFHAFAFLFHSFPGAFSFASKVLYNASVFFPLPFHFLPSPCNLFSIFSILLSICLPFLCFWFPFLARSRQGHQPKSARPTERTY